MCNLKFHFWMESIVNDLPCTAYGHRHYHYMTVRNVVRFRLLWPCYPCVGTWPKQSDEAGGLDILFTWTLKAWAGHPMITQIFPKLNQLNIWKFYKLFFMPPILPKNPKKFRCYSEMGSNTCQKKSNLDPNKNKLFFCAVINFLWTICAHDWPF